MACLLRSPWPELSRGLSLCNFFQKYRPTRGIPLPHEAIDISMPIPRNIETSADVSLGVGLSTCRVKKA